MPKNFFKNKITRKWCRSCGTRTPHKYMWWINSGEACIFWKENTSECGCALMEGVLNPDCSESSSRDKPCHGGYMLTSTCCRCLSPKGASKRTWELDEELNKGKK